MYMFTEEHREKKKLAGRAWRKANPEKARVISKRYYEKHKEKEFSRAYKWRIDNPERHAAYKSGVDPATVTTKPSSCQLCGAAFKISLDHDHKTTKFRGWLCHHCNCGLGYFTDDPLKLERAALYLRGTR